MVDKTSAVSGSEPSMVQLFVILFFLVEVFLILIVKRTGIPFVLPGDFYRIYGGRHYYVPLTTALIFTTLLFLLIRFLM